MAEEKFTIVYCKDEIAPNLSTEEWNKFLNFAARKFDHSEVVDTLDILLDVYTNRGVE